MPGIKRSSAIVKKKEKNFTGSNKSEKLYTNFVPFTNSPVSRRLLVKLKYYENISISISSGGADFIYAFRMNSITDPNFTGGGHRVYGYDSLALLYGRYRVFKCSWSISIPGPQTRAIITVVPQNGATIGTLQKEFAEYPYAISKMASYETRSSIEFLGSSFLPKLAGVSYEEYAADNDYYSAAFGSSPNEPMLLIITVENPVATTFTTLAAVTLTYWTEVYSPLRQAQSVIPS